MIKSMCNETRSARFYFLVIQILNRCPLLSFFLFFFLSLLSSEHLNKLYQQRQAELNKMLAKMQQESIKRLRKLSRARREVEGNLERRNIVKDYADPSSTTFAPLSRQGGSVHDRKADHYRVQSRHVDTFEGLAELESTLPVAVTTPTLQLKAARSTVRKTE